MKKILLAFLLTVSSAQAQFLQPGINVTPASVQDAGYTQKSFFATVSGGVITVQQSFGITSVTYTSAGVYAVTFTTAFSAAHYASACAPTGGTSAVIGQVVNPLAGSVTVASENIAGANVDPASISCIFTGN